ncbi:DUF3592 domain-containing protein [Actinoplanes sp. DH11]|uniref:DUF3592 domain-containing protein n=1 Tax=Actinoplanes sp. DH11 TaxID=2857011 RepID=UPI001E32DEE2|nr:DUF3592 domain-containing protein [Actinoplanes sp. DH11]
MGTGKKPPPAWLMLIMSVAVSGLFGYATVTLWNNDRALRDRGVETTAQVTKIGGKGRITVAYTTADGRRAEALIGQKDSADGTKVGDTVPIVYDPEHPADDVRDTRVPDNNIVTYLTLTAAVASAVGVPLAMVRMRRAKQHQNA